MTQYVLLETAPNFEVEIFGVFTSYEKAIEARDYIRSKGDRPSIVEIITDKLYLNQEIQG